MINQARPVNPAKVDLLDTLLGVARPSGARDCAVHNFHLLSLGLVSLME
jgi:hypothetical protein